VAAEIDERGVIGFPLWFKESVTVPLLERKDSARARTSNLAPRPVIFTAANGDPSMLIGHDGSLEVIDCISGAVEARTQGAGKLIDAYVPENDSADTRLLFDVRGGTLRMTDGEFRTLSEFDIGGHYRNRVSNAHATELVAVSDIDGDGIADIRAIDSRNRDQLVFNVHSTRRRGIMAELFSDTGIDQEALAVPGAGFLVRAYDQTSALLQLRNRDGVSQWSFATPRSRGEFAEGVTLGSLGISPCGEAVMATDWPSFPRPTRVIDLCDGSLLWSSPQGTFWDSTFAIGDVNGDRKPDVVFNFVGEKGWALDGRTGAVVSKPVLLPQYGELGWVDYNGSPVLLDADNDGVDEILNAGDNAHLALLKSELSFETGGRVNRVVWAAPQVSVDAQRYSMPAVAQISKTETVIAVGGEDGTLECRRASDGAVRWKRGLASGSVGKTASGMNSLSSVASCDIDGDGKVEFIVGDSDGFLYAFRATDGTLVWSISFDSPVGDPVIADIDANGKSEVLVPVADGYLYAIGQRRGRQP
jgi:outer membrane protein assembly factor BamB